MRGVSHLLVELALQALLVSHEALFPCCCFTCCLLQLCLRLYAQLCHYLLLLIQQVLHLLLVHLQQGPSPHQLRIFQAAPGLLD